MLTLIRQTVFRATARKHPRRMAQGFATTMVCASLLLAAGSAMADAEARNGQDWVRITPQPCTNAAILERIPASFTQELWQAAAEFQGTRYAPCWRPAEDAVHLIYEDGDEGLLPASTLRRIELI